ncbi:MAG: terminase gpA endonuclease subunit [Planctomycetaceae bacterium]
MSKPVIDDEESLRRELLNEIAAAWRVPRFVPAERWIPENVQMPPGLETSGPWDFDKVPHTRGFIRAYDDPAVRINLAAWAARSAKTMVSTACQIHGVQHFSLPALTLGPNEYTVDDLLDTKYEPILESCAETAAKLKPKHERNKKRGIELGELRIRRGYAGSPSTMAGFPAALLHFNEASKIPLRSNTRGNSSAQSEAHWVYLGLERAKLFAYDSKALIEGTPSRLGDCVITSMIHAPTTQIRHYLVPCPHCREHQRLQWSPDFGVYAKGGIKWEKGPDGKSDPLLAERTAYYECALCDKKITNAHRPAMMRAGVWVAEGQAIDEAGFITGQPKVESSTVAFGATDRAGFSTLYSLLISGWGQLAKEWLEAQGNSERVRSFINSSLGLVYDPQPKQMEPHQLAELLKSETPLRVCPEWTRFVTWWADVGRVGDTLIFFWGAMCWGQHARAHWIDYDVAYGEQELGEHLARMVYPVLGQRAEFRLRPVVGGIDSGGNRNESGASSTVEVYRIVDGLPGVVATKGSSLNMVDWFGYGVRKAGRSQKEIARRKKHGKGDLLYLNSDLSQKWVQDRITGVVKASHASGLTFPHEMCVPDAPEHVSVFEELLNEFPDGDTWQRIGDNERRDVLRGNRVLAEQFLASRKATWDKPPSLMEDREPAPKKSRAIDKPAEQSDRPAAGQSFRSGGFRVRRPTT